LYRGTGRYESGTALKREDTGVLVTGFPVQHRERGREKNDATSRRYRQQVRILKTLRNNMKRWGIGSANEVSSFGLESLFWNSPDRFFFSSDTHYGRLLLLIENSVTSLREKPTTLKEANGIKSLFGSHTDRQPMHYILFLEDLIRVIFYRE
jgi:hypothetical protein